MYTSSVHLNSAHKMMTAEQNYCLLQEIEANRSFLLTIYQQNPKLLACAEARIKQALEILPPSVRDENDCRSGFNPTASTSSGQACWAEARPTPDRLFEVNSAGMSRQRGISLIELIMFIVIVSVALAGILLVMNTVTRGSADPMIHKQALAIAESMLEEVELMPFTFCDPDDANAASATNSTVGAVDGCATLSEAAVIGNEGEGRYDAPQYDNVSDYHGFGMAAGAILDISNANTGVTGYALDPPITITRIGGALGLPLNDDALQITVSVTGPDGVVVRVDGIRTRYSPRGVP